MPKISRLAALLFCALLTPLTHAQSAPPSPAPAAPAIPADQQATRQQVDKLLEQMHARDQLQAYMGMMHQMVQQQLAKELPAAGPGGSALTSDQQKAVRDLIGTYVQKSMNLYTVDEMLDDMAAVYQRHFTRDDVDAYIAFYTSPAGQHLLTAQPVIMQEYMPLAMQRVQERSKALEEQLRNDMDDLLKSFSQPGTTTKQQ
jgi:hypothetical protein